MRATTLGVALALPAVAYLCGAPAAPSAPPMVEPPPEMFVDASPALRAFGQKNGMRLDAHAPLRAGPCRPGDAVVALASYFDGGLRKQWLVQIEMAAQTKEQAAEPGEGMTLYTTTGRTFQFGFSWAALTLLTVGPIAPADPRPREPEVQRVLVRLNGEYLGLGIHRATELFELERAAGEKIDYQFARTPFDASTVTAGKQAAERIGLGEGSERAFAGTVPALLEFFEIVQHTPGVQDILFQVLERPSAWTLLKGAVTHSLSAHLTFRSAGAAAVEGRPWMAGAPEVRAIPLTLSISGRPALELTLFATEPNPPLRASAGLVGLKAASPKRPDRFVILRVIATVEGDIK